MSYLNILRELESDGWDITINTENKKWYLTIHSELDGPAMFEGELETMIRQAYLYVNKVER